MKIDILPRFEVALARFVRESMSGKNEASVLEKLDDIKVDDAVPYVLLLCRAVRGRNYSRQYQDRAFLELSDIITAYEFNTEAYVKVLEAEAEIARQEQERREAQMKLDMERQQKRNLLRQYKAIQIEFDRKARVANDIYDPDQDTSKLDQLDIKELEGLVGDYGD